MKVRKGFVSNSSSSSFVIAGDIQSDKMVVTVDLSEFGTLIKTKEQLKAYYEEEYGEYDEDDRRIAKQLRQLEAGKTIFMGYVDDNLVGILDYIKGDYEYDYDY